MNSRKECPMRHTNGNCLVIGGFCTSVSDEYCNGLREAYLCGALREMRRNKWVSRMPENQSPVVVFVPPHVDNDKGTFLGYVGMAYFTRLGEGFWCGTDGNLYGAIGMIYPPTHWMPLPEPPKEVSK